MPGRRALSKTAQQRIRQNATEKYMNLAADLYQAERNGAHSRDYKPKGLRACCLEMTERCWNEEKIRIVLDGATLSRRLKGTKSKTESNAEKSLLASSEAKILIEYALACAKQGFPLNKRRLEQHATEILHARLGPSHPGPGPTWASRFIEKHSMFLKPCWSHSLDNQRARGANPATKEAFFNLLKAALFCDGDGATEPLPPELIYGVDETGIQSGIGQKEWILGQRGTNVNQLMRSGTRENITVIVTICADGSSLPPAVIFKGENYQTSWLQNNPLNASLGHSKKGYTDREIGIEWIKDFDKKTFQKAKGQRRLLLVDGHNSHYSRGFLEYARQHNIAILCYPSHSTHIYQGLDVVIFSVLKRAWTTFRDDYEWEKGHSVNKKCFLEVYAKAHIQALSKDNIISAFRKTGIVPFNPDIITEDLLAPSYSTSTQKTFPLNPDSPVQIMTDMIHHVLGREARRNNPELTPEGKDTTHVGLPETPHTPILMTPTRRAIGDLRSTALSHLVSESPPKSHNPIPLFRPHTISPFKPYHSRLLAREPKTEFEQELLTALGESENRDRQRKERMIEMQATSVLQNLYVKKTRNHLEAAEEQAEKRGKKNTLFGDGLPKLLTGDFFFDKVVDVEEAAEREAEEKQGRKERRDVHALAIKSWKAEEAARKQRNITIREEHQKAVALWENEVKAAKSEGRKPQGSRPKLGALERPVTRPRMAEGETAMDNDEQDSDEDDL